MGEMLVAPSIKGICAVLIQADRAKLKADHPNVN